MSTESPDPSRTGGGSYPTERDTNAMGRGAASSSGGLTAVLVLQPGMRPLPEYELVRKIGSGGFGEVWEALGPGGVPAALKFIRLGEKASETELRSLELMKKMRHPNLIGMSGAWQREGMLIIAMDLGDRTVMHRLQEAQGEGFAGIPPLELLEYMRDAARGLEYLHLNQIQHRDIKPHNLLIVGGGLKVADFGLAKLLKTPRTTNSGMMTPAYAAPEFFSGQSESQSDQYALAVTYCQLRGGRLPFPGTQAEMITGHLEGDPDLSMIPQSERAIVARALAKLPADRWANCPEFVAALTPVVLKEVEATQQARRKTLTVTEQPPPEEPKPSGLLLSLIVVLMLLPAVWMVLEQVRHRWETSPITPARLELPTFKSLNLFPGQKLRLPVVIQRTNCPGPLQLRLEGLPPGVTSQQVDLPQDAVTATLEVAIAPETSQATTAVKLVVRHEEGPEASSPFSLTITPKMEDKMQVALPHGVVMDTVRIPAGPFIMGSPRTEAGRGDDEAEIKGWMTHPFYMGVYEVTQGQYEAVMGKNPSLFKGDAKRPVENVTWKEANLFCEQLSKLQAGRTFRLPTEAEWEYVCRAGQWSRLPFSSGQTLTPEQANFNARYPYGGAAGDRFLGKTTVVGSYKVPNGFGLYDMHGNVGEWCLDGYFPKALPPGANQEPNEKAEWRVVRGGCWATGAAACRSAARGKENPERGNPFTGFRVLMTIQPK